MKQISPQRVRVYVAGPISKGDVPANVEAGISAGLELLELGYAPFIPHLSHLADPNAMVGTDQYERWLALDMSYISVCDALLRLPGESAGADREVAFAIDNGIPVFDTMLELDNVFEVAEPYRVSDTFRHARQDQFHQDRMRTFPTGATRDTSEGKPSYGGYMSPLVVKAFGDYMLRHETQADGKKRPAGNWKLGMSKDTYFESMFRHFMDVWLEHEGHPSREGLTDALCALYFNVGGYLHEHLTASTKSIQ